MFVEHPPKTAFGLRQQNSFFAVNDYEGAFSITPFAEYAPIKHLSFGAGLPMGFYSGEYLLSDMVVAVKGDIPVQNFKIVPVISAEFPTGNEPATSGHTELTGAVFLEKKIPAWHFYGYPGIRFSIEGEDDDHHQHQHQHHHDETAKGNVFKPHADKELFANVGVSYWITDQLGIDGRVTTYYEDFSEIAPKLQAGAVFQTTTKGGHTLKTSIDGSYTPNGVREGFGGGLSVYFAL